MPRIMVIDDDANIRAILKYRFEKEGFTVRLAANGLDAQADVNAQKPDLIVLDLMMPEMDGLQFLSVLRSNPGTRGMPVIVLTALGNNPHTERAREMGVASVIAKPFSPRRLVEQARKALNGKCADAGHRVGAADRTHEQHGLEATVRPLQNEALST